MSNEQDLLSGLSQDAAEATGRNLARQVVNSSVEEQDTILSTDGGRAALVDILKEENGVTRLHEAAEALDRVLLDARLIDED